MRRCLLTIITLLTLAVAPPAFISSPTYAASCGSTNDAKGQVLEGIGQTGNNCDDRPVTNAVRTAVQVLSIVAGIVGVIMVIYSGLKYIASGGDSAKVSSAKNSLVYALVGLFIAALAQLLVQFVLFQSNATTLPSCPANNSIKPPDCVKR